MARSPDFGSYLINSRFLRLAFTTPTFTNLSSLIKYTRRPIMQKVQCHNHLRMQVTATYASQYLVSELFNASPWPLFTFPSQYSFTFGYLGFLGLVSGLTFSYFLFYLVRFIYFFRQNYSCFALLNYYMAMTDTGTLTLYGWAISSLFFSAIWNIHTSCCSVPPLA